MATRKRSLAAFLPGVLIALVAGTFAGVIFSRAGDLNAGVLGFGVLCALFTLYGIDLIFRGAYGTEPGVGVLEGRLGLARAILGTITFGLVAVMALAAVIVNLAEGRSVNYRAGGGVVLFGLAAAGCARAVWRHRRKRRAAHVADPSEPSAEA